MRFFRKKKRYKIPVPQYVPIGRSDAGAQGVKVIPPAGPEDDVLEHLDELHVLVHQAAHMIRQRQSASKTIALLEKCRDPLEQLILRLKQSE
ncbi:MAG: hypothetical protein JW810_13200 [Sedimentisphaerales bacterium]|nr:hypothetical protein [Sedimentisphaerales bacterium]